MGILLKLKYGVRQNLLEFSLNFTMFINSKIVSNKLSIVLKVYSKNKKENKFLCLKHH